MKRHYFRNIAISTTTNCTSMCSTQSRAERIMHIISLCIILYILFYNGLSSKFAFTQPKYAWHICCKIYYFLWWRNGKYTGSYEAYLVLLGNATLTVHSWSYLIARPGIHPENTPKYEHRSDARNH